MAAQPFANLIAGGEIRHGRGLGIVVSVVDQIIQTGQRRIGHPQFAQRTAAQVFGDGTRHKGREIIACFQRIRIGQIELCQQFGVGFFRQRGLMLRLCLLCGGLLRGGFLCLDGSAAAIPEGCVTGHCDDPERDVRGAR